MDQKKAILIAAGIALLISVLIVGAIMLFNNVLRRSRTATPSVPSVVTSSPQPSSPLQSPQPISTTPAPAVRQPTSNEKMYDFGGMTAYYPSSWGILKCANSQNIEFDPYNATEQSGVACDYAIKPVTVIVGGSPACQGETVRLGNNQVTRLVTPTQTGTDYRWCVYGAKNLDITHRVSSSGSRATSRDNFSVQIEQMISNMSSAGTGGS